VASIVSKRDEDLLQILFDSCHNLDPTYDPLSSTSRIWSPSLLHNNNNMSDNESYNKNSNLFYAYARRVS